MGFPGGSDSKESVCNTEDLGSIPGSGRFPWRREWQPTPVVLPGESPQTEEPGGLYSPWGCKELDTTERLHFHFVSISIQPLSCVRIFVTPRTVGRQASLVHRILQARILEWVTIPFSRGIFPTQDQTQVS